YLSMDKEKMSKSLGNVLLVHDLITMFPGEVLRLALLGAHYRQPLDWTDEAVDGARSRLDRLYGAVRGIEVSDEDRARAEPPAAVVAALEDDINTPLALAEVAGIARQLNKETDSGVRRELALQVYAACDLLGLMQVNAEEWFAGSKEGALPAAEIESLLEERKQARENRDFAAADAIRDRTASVRISIARGTSGTRWRRTG